MITDLNQEGLKPPQNIKAEEAVLGAIMLRPNALAEVQDILKPDDFYRQTHRITFEAIEEIARRGETVDIITLTEQLKKTDQLAKVGSITFLTYLTTLMPSSANIKVYARMVRDKAVLRTLIDVANEIAASSYEGMDEVEDILDNAEKKNARHSYS